MREMDDECLLRSLIFVDNMESALRETGDLAIPLKAGVIQLDHIKADLFSMCEQSYVFERKNEVLTAVKLVAEYVNTNEMQ